MTAKGCQRFSPMAFCTECGTWLHCKRDGIDADYQRRPDREEREEQTGEEKRTACK